MNQFIALLLITLSIAQFYVIANFGNIAPFNVVMCLVGIGFSLSIVGMAILLAKK